MKYKDEEWLRETYKDNSIQEMADMIDCSTASIHKYMNKYDIKRPDKHKPKGGKHTEEEWLRQKYVDEQLSQSEVAEIADVHKGTIKHWLDQHGIETRTHSEGAKLTWQGAEQRKKEQAEWMKKIRTPWWKLDKDTQQEVREKLSKKRTGEGNPMYDVTGEDNPNWEPDKASKGFYNSKEWTQVREKVLERDGGECQACGTTDNLHVHHIVPISAGGKPFDTDNLVTLCDTHHAKYEGLYLRPDNRSGE